MKINVKHTEKLAGAIAYEEGKRVNARTITAEDIQLEVEHINRDLRKILPVKDSTGVSVYVDIHAQHFPATYRGIPESTQFKVVRFPSGWFVTEISRWQCESPTKRRQLFMSDGQKKQMADYVIRNF